MIGLRLIADGQPLLIGREAVVVVAVDRGAGVDGDGPSAGDGKTQNVAVAVEEKVCAVAGPVGRLKVAGRNVDDAAVGGCNGHCLKRTVEHGRNCERRGRGQFDIGEYGLFNRIFVVRANADADVECALYGNLDGRAGGAQRGTGSGREVKIDKVAALLNAQAMRRR